MTAIPDTPASRTLGRFSRLIPPIASTGVRTAPQILASSLVPILGFASILLTVEKTRTNAAVVGSDRTHSKRLIVIRCRDAKAHFLGKIPSDFIRISILASNMNAIRSYGDSDRNAIIDDERNSGGARHCKKH